MCLQEILHHHIEFGAFFWLFVLHVLHYVCLILDILYVFLLTKRFCGENWVQVFYWILHSMSESFMQTFTHALKTFNKLAVVNKTCIKLAINFHLCSESLMNVWWKFSSKPVQECKFEWNFHQTCIKPSLEDLEAAKNLSFFFEIWHQKKWKKSWQAHRKLQNVTPWNCKNIEEKDIAANIHDMMWNCCTQTARRNVYSNYALKRQLKWKLSLPKNFLRKSTQKNPKRNVLKKQTWGEVSTNKKLGRSVLYQDFSEKKSPPNSLFR